MSEMRVFVSHSSLDGAWCGPFVDALTQAGFDIWVDTKGLRAGAAWVQTIERELGSRPVFMLVVTPEAWSSEWVRDELQLALAMRKKIVPIIHKPTNLDGFILGLQWVNVVGLEPKAAAIKVAHALTETTGEVGDISASAPLPISSLPNILSSLGFKAHTIAGAVVITPPLCEVPDGPFTMGGATQNAFPQHVVTLPAFFMARYQLTVAEYACAVRVGAVREPPVFSQVTWQSQLEQPEAPVLCITWRDALAYADWLARSVDKRWRLPSEAQWEKAARGTDGRLFPWGNRWDPSKANTLDGSRPERRRGPAPVGMFAAGASPFGVQDMAGNVAEWTTSLYRPYPYDPSDGRESLEMPGERVARGGSWDSSHLYAQTTYRSAHYPDSFSFAQGFRLAFG